MILSKSEVPDENKTIIEAMAPPTGTIYLSGADNPGAADWHCIRAVLDTGCAYSLILTKEAHVKLNSPRFVGVTTARWADGTETKWNVCRVDLKFGNRLFKGVHALVNPDSTKDSIEVILGQPILSQSTFTISGGRLSFSPGDGEVIQIS